MSGFDTRNRDANPTPPPRNPGRSFANPAPVTVNATDGVDNADFTIRFSSTPAPVTEYTRSEPATTFVYVTVNPSVDNTGNTAASAPFATNDTNPSAAEIDTPPPARIALNDTRNEFATFTNPPAPSDTK